MVSIKGANGYPAILREDESVPFVKSYNHVQELA